MLNNQTVVVVGAGILGCTVASELTRRGCKVTVLDQAETGAATTAASFAWVNSADKEPDGYFTLNFLGLEAHERWAAAGRGRTWFHQTGNILIAADQPALAALEGRVSRAQAKEYAAEMLTPDQVRRLEPTLDLEGVLGGAFFRREGWVDVPVACSELLREVVALGGQFLPFHRVMSVNHEGRVEATTPNGAVVTFNADCVVVTAGHGIREIAESVGVDFPIIPLPAASGLTPLGAAHAPGSIGAGHEEVDHPTVGLVCTTSAVVGGPTRMLGAAGFAMRPATNGGFSLTDHPTASQWGIGDPGLLTVPDELLRRAQAVVPALKSAYISSVTLGNRVLPRDGITIADWIGAEGSIYAVATHSGVTLAPHLAETVAEQIRTGSRHESLAQFGLARFAEAAIMESGQQLSESGK